MVTVLSLEMSLWAFAWDEGDLHARVFGVTLGYGSFLVSIGQRWRFLTGSHCFYGRLHLLAMTAFGNDSAEMGLDTRE
jgi:hypothetical protein